MRFILSKIVPVDVWRLLTRLAAISMDELIGFDRELKTAVDEVLRMLKKKSRTLTVF